MNMPIQVFMEYRIKQEKVKQYEVTMPLILEKLSSLGARNINWYEAADQPNLYVEMFEVPSIAYYNEIKQERQNTEDPIFGGLDKFIDGGIQKLHCWAFIQRG